MSAAAGVVVVAAALASVAALVAIVTVLKGEFGDTEEKSSQRSRRRFAAGSAFVAGLALLGRRESRFLGYAGISLALIGFVLVVRADLGRVCRRGILGELLGVLTAWSLAVLLVTTNRLMLSSPSLVRTLYPATASVAGLAAIAVTVMILRENGDGWQLFADAADPGVAR